MGKSIGVVLALVAWWVSLISHLNEIEGGWPRAIASFFWACAVGSFFYWYLFETPNEETTATAETLDENKQ